MQSQRQPSGADFDGVYADLVRAFAGMEATLHTGDLQLVAMRRALERLRDLIAAQKAAERGE